MTNYVTVRFVKLIICNYYLYRIAVLNFKLILDHTSIQFDKSSR